MPEGTETTLRNATVAASQHDSEGAPAFHRKLIGNRWHFLVVICHHATTNTSRNGDGCRDRRPVGPRLRFLIAPARSTLSLRAFPEGCAFLPQTTQASECHRRIGGAPVYSRRHGALAKYRRSNSGTRCGYPTQKCFMAAREPAWCTTSDRAASRGAAPASVRLCGARGEPTQVMHMLGGTVRGSRPAGLTSRATYSCKSFYSDPAPLPRAEQADERTPARYAPLSCRSLGQVNGANCRRPVHHWTETVSIASEKGQRWRTAGP
jgi:hypothetical protein